MRMPPDHLPGDAVDDILQGELSVLLGNLAVKHHLQKQIAQLLAQIIRIAGGSQIAHRLIHFIRLFYRIALHALVGLRLVPGAAVFAAESGNYRMKFFKSKLSVHFTLRFLTFSHCVGKRKAKRFALLLSDYFISIIAMRLEKIYVLFLCFSWNLL